MRERFSSSGPVAAVVQLSLCTSVHNKPGLTVLACLFALHYDIMMIIMIMGNQHAYLTRD